MQKIAIVLPIRFAAADRVVQTTTRELAVEGAFVRCLEPPAAGTEVALKLYLPGTPAPEEIVAVARHLEGERESGFWAEFTQGSARSRERVVALLHGRRPEDKVAIGAMDMRIKRPSQPPPPGEAPLPDKRAFPRVEARFAVRFDSVQDFVLEYAANISAGGVFVRTDTPPAMDAVVTVSLELPGSTEAVSAKALVVHRVTPEQAKERGVLGGAGVQFIEADDAFRESIDGAIERILQKQGAAAD